MKKLITAVLFIIACNGINSAQAQTGLNNNSDWKVPVPMSTPQSATPSVSAQTTFTAIGGPAVPGMPSFAAGVTSTPSVVISTLAPAIPNAPIAPAMPSAAAVASSPAGGTLNFVTIAVSLPTVPTIASSPPLRLANARTQ